MNNTIARGRAHANDTKPLFRVGDRVEFDFMGEVIAAEVTEYRGALAVAGMHLYRVHADTNRLPQELELAEDSLRAAAA